MIEMMGPGRQRAVFEQELSRAGLSHCYGDSLGWLEDGIGPV